MNIFKKAKTKMHFATHGGSGTVLGTSSDSDNRGAAPPPVTTQPTHRPQSSSSRTSGAAAISRFESRSASSARSPPHPAPSSKESGMLSEARMEVEREKPSQVTSVDATAVKIAKKLAIEESADPLLTSASSPRVILDCPVTGKTIEYEQRLTHLQNTLQDMYLKEPLYASCLMVHTLGTNSPTTSHLVGTSTSLSETDKIAACVDTLSKCLKKILEQPDEDKYRSIRCESKALKEKVLDIAGAELFLQAVGFVQEYREFQGKEELFYILPKPEQENITAIQIEQEKDAATEPEPEKDNSTMDDTTADNNTEQRIVTDSIEPILSESGASSKVLEPPQLIPSQNIAGKEEESLTTALDLLNKVTPIKLALNRDVQVYRATSSVHRFPDLPASFYVLRSDEIKNEYMHKKEQVEVNEMLLTRAQRERLERQASRQYQFCVIRIRLPEGLVVQATFRAKEKLSDLYTFISTSLKNEATIFSLFHQGGKKLDTMTSSLQDVELVPAALVNMRVESDGGRKSILKPSLLKNIQILA